MLDASDVKKTFMDEAAQSFKLATEASQEPEPRRRKGQTNPHLVNTPSESAEVAKLVTINPCALTSAEGSPAARSKLTSLWGGLA